MIDFGRSKAYDFTGVEFLSKPITGYLENYHAAARDVVANDITMQRENHLKEIWGPITEELKDLGIQGIRDPSDQFRMFSPEMNEPKYESEANYVLNIMRENESILPGHLKGFTIEGIEEIARARGKAAREHAQEIQSRAQTKGGTAGMILGGLAGHIVDPTMWVGGMVAAPKKAYSLWQLAFYEAMIGAGLGAVQQTSVSQWYKDLGYDYTYKDFVKNVAFDAGAGAVFGVGIKLTADGARAGYRAFKKDGSANAESSAIAETAQQQQDLEADNPFQGEDLPPAQAEHQARTDAADAAFEDGNLPDIVDEPTLPLKSSKELEELNKEYELNRQKGDQKFDEKASVEAEKTAIQDEINEIYETSPEAAQAAVKGDLGKRMKAANEKLEAINKELKEIGLTNKKLEDAISKARKAAGDEAAKDNLDGVVFAFKAKDVLVDADRFQFKSGGDEFGVSERLQGIKKWNPDLAGDVLFWEDINGNIFIADGHQRRGLAMRIMANDPSQDIKLYGRLKREVDGVSAEKAMVAAAHANIANADNMTSVIDAAKILRLDPEGFEKVGLPPNSATVRQARDMMALSDDAFMSVVNGVIPANYGSILGRLIDSPELQEAAIKVLSKTSPKNADEAESIIRQVREVDVVQETQVSLFGDEVITESLYLERARVFSRAKALLLQDKKAFESLSRNADRIEAEGNKLVTNQNKRRADQDAQAIHLLQALANRKGTLSDDLTTAAREAKETGSYAKAARSYADAIRRGIERGDFDGATARDVGRTVYGPPKSAKAEIPEEPSLEGFDEPTGAAAERQADQMAIDMFRTLDEPKAADEAVAQEIPQTIKPGEIEPDWKPYMSLEDGDTLIPVSKLKSSKIRPEGVEGSAEFMKQAAKGEIDKRPAILVRDNNDGSYTVRDGNSTYAIAVQAGWPEMPVKIVSDQEYATEQARKGIDRIFKQEALGKTKRRFVVAKNLEDQEFAIIKDRLAERQLEGYSPRATRTRDPKAKQYMEMSTKNHNDLNAAAEEAAKELGMEFNRAPVKLLTKIKKKLKIKERPNRYYTISDAARTGITARSVDESDAWVAALAKKFHIIDEGWTVTPDGYFDRKLIVVFDNGGLGEIQIWPPGMLEAKEFPTRFDKSGHDYYDISKDPGSSPSAISDAKEKMATLYGQVQSDLDRSFAQKLGFGAPTAESQRSAASAEISSVRSLESVYRASSSDPVQPSSGPDQTRALEPSIATISPSLSLKNRNVSSYELTEAGDKDLIPGVDVMTAQQVIRAGSDDLVQVDERTLPQQDISDITDDIKTEDFDLEIPVGLLADEEGTLSAATRTMRDIKKDLDAEDAMINRLGVCGL
tara:strand:- start:987 stop:5012 length:4026 start_codon:yes stop_codon:yes gene_type:complete